MQDQLGSLAMPFIGMLFVILLAYLATKFISVKYTKMGSGNYIKVLERTALGQDKSLVLVRINNKIMLLGVTAKSISTVSEFAPGDISYDSALPESNFSFILKESLKNGGSFIGFPKGKSKKKGDEE